MKYFIFFSTIFSIFTESLWIDLGFDFKLFYLVVLINMIILFFFNKIIYTKGLLLFNSIIFFSGIYSIIFGYNKFDYFFIQLFFLTIIPIYYYSFYRLFEDNLEDIISIYCKLSFAIAVFGFLKLPYDMSIGRSLDSILQEPAHYCTIVLPAYFITFNDKKYPRYYSIIILLSIIISGSSLGLISLILSILLYIKNITFLKTIITMISALAIGYFIYFSFPPFKLRVDDTVKSLKTGDLSKSNISTYALVSNLYVAGKSFATKPIIGNGIGSHIHSRKKYLDDIKGIEVFKKLGVKNLNEKDGGSLFIRLTSELGLIGIFGVFTFIYKFYVRNKENKYNINAIISKAILLYFFCKLLREGHYFSPEMYFFVFLYVFNKYDSNKSENLKLKYA
jgi:hypothetical protein